MKHKFKVYEAWIPFVDLLVHNRVEVNIMDPKRKKELLAAYKARRPEMGIISFRCKETGDVFLDISRDTRVSFNSTRMKLSANMHPNKQLQKLWNEYGPDSFELTVVEVLKYKDPSDDHTDKLEAMMDRHLAANPQAKRVWR